MLVSSAVRTGNRKKHKSAVSATLQRRCFVFSLIYLKNKPFDVITSHLRFTDKDLFQGKRYHFKKHRMIRL